MSFAPVKQVFTVLGCGSSQGVPRPDGDWGACDRNNPKNKRTRAAFLIEQYADDGGKTTVVIDTGPDFREQMIAAQVKHIDAVIYTHSHADHVNGISDLRGFAQSQGACVEIYADQPTMAMLKQSFGYCLETPPGGNYPPIVNGNLIENLDKPIEIDGAGGIVSLLPIEQVHGPISSLGFRIGNVAYCSDVSDYPERSAARLHGLDHLVIDATLPKPHFSHFSLGQALEWIDRLGAKQAYLTHMHVPLDYDEVIKETPDHVQPCFDGLVFEQVL